MTEKPKMTELSNGGMYYALTFPTFHVKVYIPKWDVPCDVINYGFMTPYLLVFEEEQETIEQNVSFAKESGLEKIAKRFGGSVLFVYPNSENGWEDASKDLFHDLIDQTRISEYYEPGLALMRNRFTGEWGEIFIRGALNRSYLYGFGKSADFIVKNCLQTIEGNGLYGPGDITPVACVLQNVSVIPEVKRDDIPIVSIGNTDAINEAFEKSTKHLLIKEAPDYVADFDGFVKRYRRMVGKLEQEPDFDALNMVVEPGVCNVKVSADNCGDDKELERHDIGYVAYYHRGIMDNQNVPLVLCFHGGGDSAMCMAALSEWHVVAAKNDFLLVCVDKHMRSTATEVMELLEHLKERYSIDEQRIYSTGFSMGGAKSWDLYEQYPTVFAGVAPMDATFEIGRDVFGNYSEKAINENTLVPVFYVGGEDSPLPELPFQEKKCLDRLAYVLKVNQAKTQCTISFDEQETWENKIMGIDGDDIVYDQDEKTGSVLTMHKFYSTDGNCYTVFASASKQSHEMRHLNAKNAWAFLRQFQRNTDGEIII
ncbi:MAG: hypothetical protein Q4D51_12975 [Eubacteriales bacterium]|nr:hypothetical protein [Eubacteriales bacterium]